MLLKQILAFFERINVNFARILGVNSLQIAHTVPMLRSAVMLFAIPMPNTHGLYGPDQRKQASCFGGLLPHHNILLETNQLFLIY